MKPSILKNALILFAVTCFTLQCYGQSIQVGTVIEDTVRRAQLLGSLDESASFTARPFFPAASKEKAVFKLMPFSWKQQYNSDHPEGLNDGAMIPARGYQSFVSGGIFAKYGIVSVQLMPEFVFAENKSYQGFPDQLSDELWFINYLDILNNIDLPERFGKTAFNKVFWGQSSIRLTFKSLSLGLSNENLWWGPGMKNALLMTNSAPGFMHITLNTVKPIHTIIGSFEGQLIMGRLEASGYPNIDSIKIAEHNVFKYMIRDWIPYSRKPDDWRYMNGIVMSYQPKWLPGLFLGAARSFITYHKDLGTSLNDYFPVIIPMFKETLGNNVEDLVKRDQLASVFMRWISPESHSEIYGEYGREDHNYDLNDFLQEPDNFRAYTIGFRKLTPLKKRSNEYLDVQAEFTQLCRTLSTSLRGNGLSEASGWYQHNLVRDGYTHNGQYLGAGIGSGSSMQSMNLSWVKNSKRLGLEFKRVVHNEDFWAFAIKDYRQHWVDIGGAFIGEWNYKKFLFNARVETVGSINYQWLYEPVPSVEGQPALWWDHGKIRYNVHAELGMTYLF